MNRTRQRGMTILEVLVALFIFSLLGLAVIGLVITSTRTAIVSEQRTVAQGIINEELERIRALPYTDIGYDATTCGGLACAPVGVIPQHHLLTRNGQSYSLQTTITLIDDTLTPSVTEDYKQVTISVTLPSARAGQPPLTATTLAVPKPHRSGSGGRPCASSGPPHDCFASAHPVPVVGDPVLGYNESTLTTAATREPGEPVTCAGSLYAEATVWYKLTNPHPYTHARVWNTLPTWVAIYSGDELSTLKLEACQHGGSPLALPATGTDLWAQVGGSRGSIAVSFYDYEI